MMDYQVICMRYLWEVGEEGVNSGKAWVHVNKELMEKDRSISRASIILFLNNMVDKGALKFRSKTGKGARERGFAEYVIQNIPDKIAEEWPNEAKKVISSFYSR